jgi:hypothetical protein
MNPLRLACYEGVVAVATAILSIVGWPTTIGSALFIVLGTFGFGFLIMALLLGAKDQPWSDDPTEPPERPQQTSRPWGNK